MLGGGTTLSVPRLAFIRLRHRWRSAVLLGLGLSAAVAVAASVALVQTVTSNAGLQIAVRDLADDRFLRVGGALPDEDAYAAFQQDLANRVARLFGSLLVPRSRSVILSDELVRTTLNGRPKPDEFGAPHPRLAAYEDLQPHVEIVSGAWPSQPRSGGAWLVTMAEAGASTLQLRVDDHFCMSRSGRPEQAVCAQLAAVWRPRISTDSYWGGRMPPDTAMLVEVRDFFQIARGIPSAFPVAVAVYEPDLVALRQDDAERLLDRITRLRGLYNIQRSEMVLSTGLDRGVQRFVNRLRVAQFAIDLVAAQLLAVALYFLGFVAREVLEQQRQLLAGWRSRGWSWLRTWSVLMIEFVTVTLLATPVGLGIAWLATLALTRAIYGHDAPPLMAGEEWVHLRLPVFAAAGAGLALLAILAAAASRRSVLEVRRQASRPATRAWWQWRSLDLVLAALAVPLLLEVRIRGNSEVRDVLGAQASDPVTLVLPGIALALLALALLRLLPLLVRLIAVTRRSVAAALACWQLGRHPLQYSRISLLIVLAVSIDLFASSYAATERKNAADRVAYAAGADLRARFKPAPRPPVDQVVAGLEGVAAATAVFRGDGGPRYAALSARVLAVDPPSFQQTAWFRKDLAAEPLPGLMQKLASADQEGFPLPAEAARIGLWVHSPGLNAELSAPLFDAAGNRCACVLGQLDFTGWRYLEAPIAVEGSVTPPLRLRALRLRAAGTGPAAGVIAVSGLGVVPISGDRPVVVESFTAPDGWWRAAETGLNAGELKASAGQLREGAPSVVVPVDLRVGPVALHPPPSGQPVPALAATRTLRRFGIEVREPFPLQIDGQSVLITVVGTVDHFPTLYPEKEDFLVVARDPFLAAWGQAGSPRAWPNEVWLKAGTGPVRVAGDRLRIRPDVIEVSDRRSMEAAALRDPLRLDLEAILLIGSLATLALAVAGFGLHSFLAVKGRQSEYAILLANGLSQRALQRSIIFEQSILLGFTILAGVGAGLVLAWVILPALQLGTGLVETVPRTVLVVDPALTAGAVTAVCLGALAAGRLAVRAAGRLRLMDELRLLG